MTPKCAPRVQISSTDAFSVTPDCWKKFAAFFTTAARHISSDRFDFLLLPLSILWWGWGQFSYCHQITPWEVGNFRRQLSRARLHSLFVSGRAHQRRWGILIGKVLRKVALWSVTPNLLSRAALSGPGRHPPLAHHLLSLPLLPASPKPPPLPVWHLHVLLMPGIFRIIPNLIAVSLLVPAAAVPKIKSCPRKETLDWSFLIDQMLCCSKNSGPHPRRGKLQQTCRCWISNMITLIGLEEHLYIYIFEHFPRVDWQYEWKHTVH